MSRTTDDIVVGADGSIFVAPVGTAVPADTGTAFGAGWVELGYTDENGLKFTDGKTIVDIPVWQLFYPARKIITARDFTVDFALRQFDGPTVSLAFGGGTVASDGGGGFTYEPPDPSFIDERALACEWLDGDKIYRLFLPKGLVTSSVATEVVRTKASDLPITFGIIGQDGIAPWALDTNDASFADLVGS